MNLLTPVNVGMLHNYYRPMCKIYTLSFFNNLNFIQRSWYIKSSICCGKINNKKIEKEKALPEFTYAGKNLKSHKRIYGMGCISHGGLGVKFFFKPKNKSKLKPQVTHMHRPYRIYFGDLMDVRDLACGYGFTVFAVKTDKGSPYSCYGCGISTSCQIGHNAPQEGCPLEIVIEPVAIQIPLKEDTFVTKVSCGRAHTIVSTNTDELWTFGNNSFGQCGRPIIEHEDDSKVNFYKINKFTQSKIDQLECGQDNSFVLSGGEVYSCGWSADGQTGQETFDNVASFGKVAGDLKGEKVVKVSSKGDCVLALNEKGELFGWGNNEYRQLNCVTNVEQLNVPRFLNLKLPKIIDIAAGGTSCYVLTEENEVLSWGFGTIGRGPSERSSEVPLPIPRPLFGRNALNKDSKVVKIFAGMTGAAAINSEGGLYTWGRNNYGMTGLGDQKTHFFPLKVCMTSVVRKVSLGIDHMMVFAKSVI